jgi:hypothetical protein
MASQSSKRKKVKATVHLTPAGEKAARPTARVADVAFAWQAPPSSCKMSDLTPKQKKARFRQLAKQDRLRTARAIAEERESPFLPFPEFGQEQPRRSVKWGPGAAKARGRR